MEKLIVSEKSQIALVYRPNTPKALRLAQDVAKWLKEKGHVVMTAPEQKMVKGTVQMKRASQFDKVKLIIVLGGDGTYLRAVRMLEGRPVPILGINMGSLGFLTVVREDEVFAVLKETLDGQCELHPRTMMQIKLKRSRKIVKSWIALNDVVIERGPFSQLIDLALTCDHKYVSDVKADGLIVATPTGSTAYSLAAGGPILHPELGGFISTPVAPHSLTTRPFLFPEDLQLKLKLKGQCLKAHIVVDGQKREELKQKDELLIEKSALTHFVLRLPNYNYYDVLREKLKFGERD